MINVDIAQKGLRGGTETDAYQKELLTRDTLVMNTGQRYEKPSKTNDSPKKWNDGIATKINCNHSMPDEFCQIFPKKLEDIMIECLRQNSMPISFQIAAIMACGGAALGSSRILQVKQGYQVPGIIWSAAVGNPGANKSTPLSFYAKPLKERTIANHEKYKKALALYEQDQKDEGAIGYQRPAPFTQYYMESATMEKIYQIANANPRGMLNSRDELLSWIGDMDKYRKGGDRKTWLSSWNGNGFWSQSKGEDIIGKCSHLCICGGVQPGSLRELARGPEDGFLERILFFGDPDLEEIPLLSEYKTNCDVSGEWAKVIDRLLSLNDSEDGRIIAYDDTAMLADRNYQEVFADEARDGYSGVYAKLNEYRKRTALILTFLDWACKQDDVEAPKIVEGDTVIRAQRLMEYCASNAKRVRELLNSNPLERLDTMRKNFYDGLRSPFSTEEAKKVAASVGMQERTMFRFLKDNIYFQKMSQGLYSKKY